MTAQQLPVRKLFLAYRTIGHYHPRDLKKIADIRDIFRARRQFYKHCYNLAAQYFLDLMSEQDFHELNNTISTHHQALLFGRRFAEVLQVINTKGPAHSWYREMTYAHDCEMDTNKLLDDVMEFISSMEMALTHLPAPPRGRPKLALRKWANRHMDFWEHKLGRRVTISNTGADGMSKCHQFLHDLLVPIDHEAVVHLPTIIRERRSAQRQRTGRAFI